MPFADELTVDTPLPVAPDITLDEGIAAQYQAIVGDSSALPLSTVLSQQVTGFERLANPGLVLQLAIGQSTVATRRVIANLFYRDVAIHQQVAIGRTLRTVVTPRAIQASKNPERAKVLLGIHCTDDQGKTIADFQRLALLPVQDPGALVEAGFVGDAESEAKLHDFAKFVPSGWNLEPFPGEPLPELGSTHTDQLRDTITSSIELARLTQNLAQAHRDPVFGQEGRRLVYGGHVIGLAQASISRLLRGLITVIGWRSCNHLAPVFEQDIVRQEITVLDRVEIENGALVEVRCRSFVQEGSGERQVLDWLPVLWVKE